MKNYKTIKAVNEANLNDFIRLEFTSLNTIIMETYPLHLDKRLYTLDETPHG